MTTITSQQSIHINKHNTLQTNIRPGNYNVLSVNIPNGMTLRDCECAISELNIYNSIFNVSAALQNNQISLVYLLSGGNGLAVYNFTVPAGIYQIADLNNWLQTTLIANGLYSTISGTVTTFISFTYNPIYLNVTVTASPCTGGTAATPSAPSYTFGTGSMSPSAFLSGKTPVIYFGQLNPGASGAAPITVGGPTNGAPYNPSNSNLSVIVGANPAQIYPSVFFNTVFVFPTSTQVVALPNIPQDNEYNTILVNCNLVNSTLMPQYNRAIFAFSPSTVSAGTQLSFSPYPDFFQCVDGYYNQIVISFVDETESPVPIIDPTMSVTILIRPKPISDSPDESDLGTVKSIGAQVAPPPSDDYDNRPPPPSFSLPGEKQPSLLEQIVAAAAEKKNRVPSTPSVSVPTVKPTSLIEQIQAAAAEKKKRARPEALERPITTFPNELTAQVAAAHAKRQAKKALTGKGMKRQRY